MAKKINLTHASDCYLRTGGGPGELFCSCGARDAMNEIARLTTENKALRKRARAAESDWQACNAELRDKCTALIKIQSMLNNGDMHDNPVLYTPDKIKKVIEQARKAVNDGRVQSRANDN